MKISKRHKEIINAGCSLVLSIALSIGFSGCSHSQKDHLSEDEMARLMADLYLGESLIDYNYTEFPNDSTRKVLRQSIYAKNGVTQELVDSSMAWYGRNIEQFVAVQEKAEELLRERQASVARDARFAVSENGDSVTLWEGPRRLLVGERMPSRILGFSVAADSTWRDEDYFTLYLKPINATPEVKARLLIDYADGSTSYSDLVPSYLNRYQVNMKADSTMMPLRIYGYIMFQVDSTGVYEVDSIYLTQQRKERIAHYYNVQQTFNPNPVKESGSDSSDVDEEALENSSEEYSDTSTERSKLHTERRTHYPHGASTKSLPKASFKQSQPTKRSGASPAADNRPKQTGSARLTRNQKDGALQPAKPVK